MKSMSILGFEMVGIALAQPMLAWLFAEAVPPGLDITGITNLGATAVVSLLLIWVITKDRPSERDAFLKQLAQNQKDGYEALKVAREQFMSELNDSRKAASDDRALDRDLRKEVLTRVHEIISINPHSQE